MFNLLSFVRQNYKILAYIHNITIEKYKIINNPLSSKLELKSQIILFFLHIAALTSAKIMQLNISAHVSILQKKTIKGGGISCSYAYFGICEAIFRGRELIFFVGAHISIYFVNIKFFFPHLHINHPTKRKK